MTVLVLITGSVFLMLGRIDASSLVAGLVLIPPLQGAMTATLDMVKEVGLRRRVVLRLGYFYRHARDYDAAAPIDVNTLVLDDVQLTLPNGVITKPISVTLRKGDIIVLAGPNGAGKTTLLQTLAGLGGEYSGSIRVDGVELRELALGAWRATVHYVPQFPYFFSTTVAENALFGEDQHSVAVRDRLATYGFTPALTTPLEAGGAPLSGGEQQKLQLCRPLRRHGFTLLLIDEPSNNLDAASIAALRSELERHRAERITLLVTHDARLTTTSHQTLTLGAYG